MQPLPAGVKPVTAFTRVTLLAAAALAAIAGIQLYVFTDYTDQGFAWTIAAPLSAAFLGAGYWTGVVLLGFATRETAWANIRVAIAAVTAFAPLMTVVTFLHLDRFHLDSPIPMAWTAAWAWMIVYAIVPFALLAVLIVQWRTPGGDPEPAAAIPLSLRIVIGVSAVISLILALVMLFSPQAMFPYWPWALTPLTARAIGTGFAAVFVASMWFIRENSWGRGRVGTVSYLLVGSLQLLAIVRYPGTVEWNRPGAWLYVFFMLAILGAGIISTVDAWRRPPATRGSSIHSG